MEKKMTVRAAAAQIAPDLTSREKTLARVQPVLACALDAARCSSHDVASAELEDGVFEVRDAVFAEKTEKPSA